ncbi:hypothetical protein S1OALGB6SA_1322 [Olavius algarvensis spirochete endosymbiont]|uniref:hypothetical protein n=1 Tax=Olavius algarvensis spirochete endosymbiont TaxID=260710 RepID=UPI000F186115|nr:hypothetical protein [Olavius algarvensis spirochete endosymbiont]CAD7845847.1 MAG: hypothetical protein [Olavius algarvensis spirochete endosymbiont]VDB00247.1 hypothetical protein S1OALGB6SA_1322 [Olavius algarvensis spirochete endosymbiont]
MNRYKRIRQGVIAAEQEIVVLGTVAARKNRGKQNLKNGIIRQNRRSLPNNERAL